MNICSDGFAILRGDLSGGYRDTGSEILGLMASDPSGFASGNWVLYDEALNLLVE